MGMQRTDVQGRFSTMLDNFSTKHCDVTTLTSAWIETLFIVAIQTMTSCRTLTSAWIETFHHFRVAGIGDVALSRVRGLKRFRRPYP